MIKIQRLLCCIFFCTLSLTTVKCQVVSVGSCPNIQGTPQVTPAQLSGLFYELQKSSVVPSSLFPTCLTVNVFPDPVQTTFVNVQISYRDSIDGVRKTIRGTLELNKLTNAAGNPVTSGSDFILRLQDSPLQLVPQLTSITNFPIKLLNGMQTADGSRLLIFYSCQDLPSLPFLPVKSESIWVLGLLPTNVLTQQGRDEVLQQLRSFSIDDTFLKDTSQVCT